MRFLRELGLIGSLSLIGSVLLTIIIASEVILRIVSPIPIVKRIRSQKFYNYSVPAEVGIMQASSKSIVETEYINGVPSFHDVVYDFDSHGFRKIPSQENSLKGRDQYLVVLGASIDLGYGLGADMVVANLLAEKLSNYHVYNFSTRGWGVQNYLAAVNKLNIRDLVTEKKGFVLVSLIVDHEIGYLQRFFGSSSIDADWYRTISSYGKKDGSTFEFEGLYPQVHPFKYFLYTNLQKSQILRFFNLSLPSYGAEDYKAFAEFLAQLDRRIREILPNSKVFFVNHPFSDDESSTQLLKATSTFPELRLIDLNGMVGDEEIGARSIKAYYPHPNAETNKEIASEIVRELGKFEID